MKPILQAIVLADHVYRDDVSKKRVIAGTFNRLWIRRAPLSTQDAPSSQGNAEKPASGAVEVPAHEIETVGSPWLYVNFTDIAGDVTLQLRFVDLSDYRVVFEGKLDARGCNKLEANEFHFPLPALHTQVTHPGVYAIELLWNDEPLGSLRVHVIEHE